MSSTDLEREKGKAIHCKPRPGVCTHREQLAPVLGAMWLEEQCHGARLSFGSGVLSSPELPSGSQCTGIPHLPLRYLSGSQAGVD